MYVVAIVFQNALQNQIENKHPLPTWHICGGGGGWTTLTAGLRVRMTLTLMTNCGGGVPSCPVCSFHPLSQGRIWDMPGGNPSPWNKCIHYAHFNHIKLKTVDVIDMKNKIFSQVFMIKNIKNFLCLKYF